MTSAGVVKRWGFFRSHNGPSAFGRVQMSPQHHRQSPLPVWCCRLFALRDLSSPRLGATKTPADLRTSGGAGGFQIHGVKPGLGPNPGASSEHIEVYSSSEPSTLPVFRVHQMRLGARKARYLDAREVIVFGHQPATAHRSPPRGPPPRQVPASRPLAIPNGGPGALAGGPEGAHKRDARTAPVVPPSMP